MFPKHGELRGSERWDKPSAAWVSADEWQHRQWAREDAAFARLANQGELKCPSVISDTMKRDLQSQVTGRMYDSKSSLRREYREHGVQEVGSDVPKSTAQVGKFRRPDGERKLMDDCLRRAKSELDIPTTITKVVKDEAGMRKLRAEGKIF
jgi:hypothetical protein